ncbi:heterokaryon incompatibility protein-domain-containing protein [Podospora aff. communis PSN243]|uniref:Heterokaryon incompatibility protein-domain-containing protein n=1 Tax=Podospora aff. communis PSN243 TaxID=3040156 RepID=A0AAV9FXC4_9PEZI|nr:heterokaryon incompatibility protein-domain-containing protein [Podospora aff. communis PSN243]
MRLINVETMQLEEFWDDQTPPYAILSHTWEEEEVSYQDFLNPAVASQKRGYGKIVGACNQAKKDKLRFVWVDTNCIDKASSAELSEAINSMFNWYEKAAVCYAYLSDVSDPSYYGAPYLYDNNFVRAFSSSRWFTRGWTLQELLAPATIKFFSDSWTFLSDRKSLLPWISTTTGISTKHLHGRESLNLASVACKMSWLARRKTSRREDMAYCILGLFDINMPLLYGEGNKAFVRLQEEILKSSNDHTLFSWSWNKNVPSYWTSLLAPSPDTFASAGNFIPRRNLSEPIPYQMTNYGLSITLPYVACWKSGFLMLNVRLPTDKIGIGEEHAIAIPVRPCNTNPGLFERIAFPRSPVLFDRQAWSVTKHVVVQSRSEVPGAVRSYETMTNSTLSKYTHGFILTIPETVFLLNPTDPRYEYWKTKPTNRLLQDISSHLVVETLPRGHCFFDSSTSVFWMSMKETENQGCAVMKISADGTQGVVLVFKTESIFREGNNRSPTTEPVSARCMVLPEGLWERSTSDGTFHRLYSDMEDPESSHIPALVSPLGVGTLTTEWGAEVHSVILLYKKGQNRYWGGS